VIYDTANTRINLSIIGTDTLKWTGAINGDWDIGSAAGVGGTSNWKLVAGGTATNFINTDSITFDGSATRFAVNLTTAVQPNSITVNAAANYTFTGPGKLSGATGLTKAGSGTLSIATDNDYIGGTTVNAGTLQLGNGGTTGNVVGTITLNDGALAFNRSDAYAFANTVALGNMVGIVQNGSGTVTMTNPLPVGTNTIEFGGSGNLNIGATVSGTGILNKTGSGTLTLLANNNTFTGTLNVNAGTVLLEDLGAGGDLGASSIVVNSGGTFILGPSGNSDLPNISVATINPGGLFRLEQGENFGGFILNGGEFCFVSTGRTGVNLTGVAPVDGAVVYDLRSGTITTDFTAGSGGALNQSGNATTPVFGILAKTTNGTVTVSGGVTFQAALALQIREGTLTMGPANSPATGTAAITLGDTSTNGTLQNVAATSRRKVDPLPFLPLVHFGSPFFRRRRTSPATGAR
jgi:autotransporter-associated beta strand protein